MALVDMKVLLQKARREGYAVPAFNITDLQSIQVVVAVCEEENAPCLMEAAEPTLRTYGADYLVAMAEVAARRARVPVAFHLDHGKSFEVIMAGIRAGFTSVMIDASEKPFDENAAITKRIVDIAHACGVSVEAELGHVGVADHEPTAEEKAKFLTDPDEAARFVQLTQVDALAVAVGTAHGMYKYEPQLDLERLQAIAARVPLPLVLHGGSGTPGLERTPPLGIAKINIFTDLQIPIREKAKEILTTVPLEKLMAPRIWKTANEAAAPVVRERIRLLGAAGKA
jgi:fructose-bisphosphate aldolase class II